MSAVSLPAYDVRTGARLWRRLLVVAAIGQAVSSILVSRFGGAFTTADRAGEPPIVPPGWTFTIWSVIIALSLIMLAALLRALMYAMDQRQAIRAWSPLARVLLWGTLGLYTGWSSVAVWLNLTTALIGSGAPITTPPPYLAR